MHRVLQELSARYPDLAECIPDVERTYDVLKSMYQRGGKLLLCGNGGSAADCEHIVGELMKGFLSRRPLADEVKKRLRAAIPDAGVYLADHLQGSLAAISLVSQTSLISACANDIAADMVFAQQVYGYGVVGDVVMGISTSGNSRNVLHALQVGKALGLQTVGLTGQSGGLLRAVCDVTICVPYDLTPEIQECHLPIYHALCVMLEEAFTAPAVVTHIASDGGMPSKWVSTH
jgi:D-sedoheptulose 7-phosphate isomerase